MKLTKVGKFWHYRFMVRGKRYHGSTNLTKERDAELKAAELRKQIILGNVGILKAGPAPRLKVFLEKEFLPFVRVAHKAKEKTLEYYTFGAKQLTSAKIGSVEIDQITNAEAVAYRDERSDFSPSGINQGLRTLRRALRLAFQWKKIGVRPVISLAGGENQRKLVVDTEFEALYLECAREPWRTMTTIIVEVGLRPNEVFNLRVEHLDFNGMVVSVLSGKSDAAQRELPMTDAVYLAVKSWLQEIGDPASGWLFPSPALGRGGKPYAQQRASDWHHATLGRMLEKAEKDGLERIVNFLKEIGREGAERLVPYTFRHTALTRLAEHTPNPYAVAAAAGHSTITMTYRYVHPQRAEIWKAFEAKGGTKIGNAKRRDSLKVVGNPDEEGN